jgi:hypothetical protein
MYPEYDDGSTICTPDRDIKQNQGFARQLAPLLGVFRSFGTVFLGGQNDRFVPQSWVCTRFLHLSDSRLESGLPHQRTAAPNLTLKDVERS